MGENKRVAAVSKCGPVAQLGARFHGMEEVVGSIPTRSTNSPKITPFFLHTNNDLEKIFPFAVS